MDSHKESSADGDCVYVPTFNDDDYRQYELLIHKFARKQHKALLLSGVTDQCYEDVFQEVALSFVAAKRKFNEKLGYRFSTYACNAAMKNFLQFIKRLRKHSDNRLYLEELTDSENEFSWEELIAKEGGDECSPSMKMRIARERISELSKDAKVVVRELLYPSSELKKMHFAKLEYSRMAKLYGGKAPRVSEEIDIQFIFQHYGVKTEKRRSILKELSDAFEVTF